MKNRNFKRFIIFAGDIISLFLLIGVFLLDTKGYIEQIIPALHKPCPTFIAFGIFIVLHIYQRYHFTANRPNLHVKDIGWQPVSRGERLYISIENLPTVLTTSANSISTGAIITLLNNKLTKEIAQFTNVRWQGTSPPVPEKNYQPYDYWCVDIESGRERYLYLGARITEDSPAYLVSDKNYYKDGRFEIGGVEIPQKSYFKIIIWASNFDRKELWFRYKKGNLTQFKRKPKKKSRKTKKNKDMKQSTKNNSITE